MPRANGTISLLGLHDKPLAAACKSQKALNPTEATVTSKERASDKPKTKRDKLVIDTEAEEWGSDEGEEDVMGHKMHRENLRILTGYLHRPGLWRVRLGQVYEVLEVAKGAKGGPPQPNEFSIKVTADGEPPTSGSLSRLCDQGASYVRQLVIDLQKVARAKNVAHADAIATQDSSRGEAHVKEIMRAVGELPMGKAELEEQQKRREQAEEAERAAQRERDRLEVDGLLGQLSMEEEMRKAAKKAAKRARQKARQKERREETLVAESHGATAPAANQAEDDGIVPDVT